ncbi:hypothetical protein CCP3SC1AL1_130016 [Gammaproteobacteria bacterium]
MIAFLIWAIMGFAPSVLFAEEPVIEEFPIESTEVRPELTPTLTPEETIILRGLSTFSNSEGRETISLPKIRNVWTVPRLAARWIESNQPGEVTRAIYLLEAFLRQTPKRAREARRSADLLLSLARERERRMQVEADLLACESLSVGSPKTQDTAIRVLQRELEEAREGRETARREVAELRRKLRDLTSIEKSMDERKSH